MFSLNGCAVGMLSSIIMLFISSCELFINYEIKFTRGAGKEG